MKRNRTSIRGLTMLELMVSTGIMLGVMAAATTLYVGGTRGFYREQSESYVQFRVRTSLDEMAKETRSAKSVLPSFTYGGNTYTASTGAASPACLILQVPAQDTNGFFYYGTTNPAGNPYPSPNTLAMDTVIYFHVPNEEALKRLTFPARNVIDNNGQTRNSQRPLESSPVIESRNVKQFKLSYKDKDGKPLNSPSVKGASVDLTAMVEQDSTGMTQQQVSVTGIRLRNMRSGSIYGMLSPAVANCTVEAVVTSTTSAYPKGTIVGRGVSNTDGSFEVFGLVGGTYQMKITKPYGSVIWDANTNVMVEDEQATNIGTLTLS